LTWGYDEIYGRPVLVGVDARSTYCYLLAAAGKARDTFSSTGTMEGLNPEYGADAAKD